MPRNKSKQARRADEWAKQRAVQEISWKTVAAILGSIAVLVGSIVSGLDFINYLREGYQQFLWLGIAVFGVVWLIVLWLLVKQRNIYWMLYLMLTVLGGVVIWNGWRSNIQTREEKLIVLIAKFDGPEEVYGLRNEILEKLNADFANDTDVEIESVNEVITPDSDSGSPRARKLGESLQAGVVIWGWYRSTENPNITIHFENLSPNQITTFQESEIYQPQATIGELESFEVQKKLGTETRSLILFLTGVLNYKVGNYHLAINRFEEIILEKDLSTFIDPVLLYFYLGYSHNMLNNYSSSLLCFDKAINLNPNFASAYINRGSVYSTLGQYEDALKDFDKAIALDPNTVYYYTNRGETYKNLGQYERAMQDYNKAIELNPNSGFAYSYRGNLYVALGQYERAIQEYDKAIKLDPDSEFIYYDRGSFYYQLKQYERALQDFSKVIELNSEFGPAYFDRGNIYDELGQYERAIQDLNKVIELKPDSIAAYNNRGFLYSELEQYELAIQDFNKAIELDPNFLPAYYKRALAYKQLGRTPEAEADFKKYEELTGEKP